MELKRGILRCMSSSCQCVKDVKGEKERRNTSEVIVYTTICCRSMENRQLDDVTALHSSDADGRRVEPRMRSSGPLGTSA